MPKSVIQKIQKDFPDITEEELQNKHKANYEGQLDFYEQTKNLKPDSCMEVYLKRDNGEKRIVCKTDTSDIKKMPIIINELQKKYNPLKLFVVLNNDYKIIKP